jgi:hypothetical protein
MLSRCAEPDPCLQSPAKVSSPVAGLGRCDPPVCVRTVMSKLLVSVVLGVTLVMTNRCELSAPRDGPVCQIL